MFGEGPLTSSGCWLTSSTIVLENNPPGPKNFGAFPLLLCLMVSNEVLEIWLMSVW